MICHPVRRGWWSVVFLVVPVIAVAQTPNTNNDAIAKDTAPKESAPKDAPPKDAPAKDAATPAAADHAADLKPGESRHGEVFNEGPRQAAYLIEGVGKARFPVTTKNPQAQKFVEQGIAQLHGFWYFEAERSFREAAFLDPDCAIAYWGMAQANRDNQKRAKGFMAEAVKRKDKVTRREQLYIESFDAYCQADPNKKKERAEAYTRGLEKILYEFPDDVEARAWLALQLWSNRDAGIPISSHLAIDALIEQVFQTEPMHPAHHYRIHLWDYERPENALKSAALCGPAAPAIAHMWHMPGHIYSRLKRYEDACWQQEASARVDHAHMMRDRVLPDQIHNFAHNNEWLIRDLNFVGRVGDAIALSKNMIELPRHPKYNTLAKGGSSKFGRMRLFETLVNYELWDELVALCDTPYLEPTDEPAEQVKRLRRLGAAEFRRGGLKRGLEVLGELKQRLDSEGQARDKAVLDAEKKASEMPLDQAVIDKAASDAEAKAKTENKEPAQIEMAKNEAIDKARGELEQKKKEQIEKSKNDAKKPFDDRIKDIEKAIDELQGYDVLARQDFKAALELFKKAGGLEETFLHSVQFDAGERDEALKAAQKLVDGHKNEVLPLASLVELQSRAGKTDEAKATFEQLRAISNVIEFGSPVFRRLAPIAKQLGLPEDWRVHTPPPADVGNRVALDSLGPFRWQPSQAPSWTLADAQGKPHELKEFQGKPLILMFYLGSGCLHCAEQLQKFGAVAQEFRSAGFELAAISTDNLVGLETSLKNYKEGPMPILLLSNDQLDVFKAYRCYDDFEQQTLHGTFLIDGAGRVRWQDISFEPFQDPRFVLQEAKRLLSQTGELPQVPGNVTR